SAHAGPGTAISTVVNTTISTSDEQGASQASARPGREAGREDGGEVGRGRRCGPAIGGWRGPCGHGVDVSSIVVMPTSLGAAQTPRHGRLPRHPQGKG
ncbi:MAG: hypothetical protein RLY78_546, partial [Pseudomonadota bacterium]